MSAILELLLRLAYVLLAALGSGPSSGSGRQGFDATRSSTSYSRSRRNDASGAPSPCSQALRPRSARCTISDEGRRLLREGRTEEVAEALAREISARSRA